MSGDLRSRWASWLMCALAGLLLAAALVALNWSAISVPHIEAGDFAANSLLVDEAERLSLVTGHYSRFGFFHPGPALLYILAAGEWTAFDVLGAVPSGLSGQLVAVAVYGAAWLVLLARVVRQWSSDWRLPALGTLAFVATVTLFDHQFINGLWFPLMYLLPFALLVVSMSAVAAGWPRALLYTALASGVLINGHASFIVLVPVFVMCMVLANLALSRGHPQRRLASRAWMRAHGRVILGATGIVAVFLVPLAIRTAQDPPGPLVDYLGLDRSSEPLSLSDALGFTAQFWGGPAPFAIAMVALTLLVVGLRDTSRSTRAARGLSAGSLAGTLTVLLYALVGVDSMANAYLGYFAYALPGVLALAVLTWLWPRLAPVLRSWAVGVVMVIGALLLAPAHVTTAVPPDYDRPDAAEIRATLRAAAVDGPVVLDLDSTGDWSTVWSTAVALRLLDVRAGERLVCIDDNWSILFTEAARCTTEERMGSVRYRVTSGSGPSASDAGITLERVEPLAAPEQP